MGKRIAFGNRCDVDLSIDIGLAKLVLAYPSCLRRFCWHSPYDYEGWCKHLVSVALTAIRKPETIQQRLSLNELLDRLNHVQTQTLVQELVAKEPNLLNQIDRFVTKISPLIVQATTTTTVQPKRQTSVDPQSYRYQTKQMLQNCLQQWEEGGEENPIDEDLPEILDRVQAFIDRGGGSAPGLGCAGTSRNSSGGR